MSVKILEEKGQNYSTSSSDNVSFYSNSTYCKSNKDDCNVKVKINTIKVERRERTFYNNRNISKHV